ncbi:MAG: hypothetical protein ACREBQ_09590, partial [Nitrososphaerales archaeon]
LNTGNKEEKSYLEPIRSSLLYREAKVQLTMMSSSKQHNAAKRRSLLGRFYRVVLGVILFGVAGYSWLLSSRLIQLNGWYEVYSSGGLLGFVAFSLVALGLCQ